MTLEPEAIALGGGQLAWAVAVGGRMGIDGPHAGRAIGAGADHVAAVS